MDTNAPATSKPTSTARDERSPSGIRITPNRNRLQAALETMYLASAAGGLPAVVQAAVTGKRTFSNQAASFCSSRAGKNQSSKLAGMTSSPPSKTAIALRVAPGSSEKEEIIQAGIVTSPSTSAPLTENMIRFINPQTKPASKY